jgi:hypothetical protein
LFFTQQFFLQSNTRLAKPTKLLKKKISGSMVNMGGTLSTGDGPTGGGGGGISLDIHDNDRIFDPRLISTMFSQKKDLVALSQEHLKYRRSLQKLNLRDYGKLWIWIQEDGLYGPVTAADLFSSYKSMSFVAFRRTLWYLYGKRQLFSNSSENLSPPSESDRWAVFIMNNGILRAPRYKNELTLYRWLRDDASGSVSHQWQTGEIVPNFQFLSTGFSPYDKGGNFDILLKIQLPPDFPFFIISTQAAKEKVNIEHREVVLPFTLDETGKTFNYGFLVKKVQKQAKVETEDLSMTVPLVVTLVPISVKPKPTRLNLKPLVDIEFIADQRQEFLDDQ